MCCQVTRFWLHLSLLDPFVTGLQKLSSTPAALRVIKNDEDGLPGPAPLSKDLWIFMRFQTIQMYIQHCFRLTSERLDATSECEKKLMAPSEGKLGCSIASMPHFWSKNGGKCRRHNGAGTFKRYFRRGNKFTNSIVGSILQYLLTQQHWFRCTHRGATVWKPENSHKVRWFRAHLFVIQHQACLKRRKFQPRHHCFCRQDGDVQFLHSNATASSVLTHLLAAHGSLYCSTGYIPRKSRASGTFGGLVLILMEKIWKTLYLKCNGFYSTTGMLVAVRLAVL